MQQNAGTVICLLMKINALKHVSGPDIAEGCFDKEKRYEGTVWVRFKSQKDFGHTCNEIRERLREEVNYEVRIYLMDTNEMQKQVLKGRQGSPFTAY